MFRRLILSVGLLIASQWAYAERVPITMTEDSREANTSTVALPASNAGTLLFRDCTECNRNPLKLTAGSHYFLGAQEVSFEQFKAAYNQQADQLFTVCFKPDTHAVTRIKLNPIAAKPAAAH